MRKLTIKEKQNGELAMRGLSFKADWFYGGADPLTVAEYEEDDKTLYAIRGCLGDKDGITFEELQEMFEDWADEALTGLTYEDPEGEWEVIAVDGDKMTVKCVQEGNPNYGRDDFCVDFKEVWHYICGR